MPSPLSDFACAPSVGGLMVIPSLNAGSFGFHSLQCKSLVKPPYKRETVNRYADGQPFARALRGLPFSPMREPCLRDACPNLASVALELLSNSELPPPCIIAMSPP